MREIQKQPPILRMEAIHKNFANGAALYDVSLEVQRGEVHMLLGENGAGKSTLMSILAGVYPCDSGQIWWHGRSVHFKSPRDAQQAGICTIYQETSLISELTVGQNIFLGNEPTRLAGIPLIDRNRMIQSSQRLLRMLDLDISPDAPVADLSMADRRMVETAKALRQSADLIIMDEPTTSFTPPETDTLFQVIRTLTQRGVAIIYITHRLEEVSAIGDRATVLRDGRNVATVNLQRTTPDELTRLIAGRALEEKFPRRRPDLGHEVLQVKRLTRYGHLNDISFNVKAGEIVGIAGLRGSGRTALLRAIFGLDPFDEGTIYLNGQEVSITSPKDAIGHGIGLLTENREEQGLILEMNTADNITLAVLEQDSPTPLLRHDIEMDVAQHYIRSLNIKPPSPQHLTRYLSGGMQQKVVLARWLATKSALLMFDQPTRGIDVGSKTEIYRFMADLAEQGIAILMVSSDMPEILGMCDRILVLYEGILVASLPQAEATMEKVLAYANGRLTDG